MEGLIRILHLVLFLNLSEGNNLTQQLYDSISFEKVSISGVKMGTNENILTLKFGKPGSIRPYYNEFEEKRSSHYYFKKSYFTISDNKVEGFNIVDSSFVLDYHSIHVGVSAKILEITFPISYKHQFADNGIQKVKVTIGNSDDYVLFSIDRKKIIRIETWSDQ